MLSVQKVQGANKKNKVFLYTLSTCGWCKKTKQYLSDNDIEYEYLDVDKCSKEEQKEAVKILKEKKVPVAFPVIIIDDNVIISGYKPEKIAEELGI
jgi:glutaredoxin-like protein NrdH